MGRISEINKHFLAELCKSAVPVLRYLFQWFLQFTFSVSLKKRHVAHMFVLFGYKYLIFTVFITADLRNCTICIYVRVCLILFLT
jgi:hypothetical protein